MPRNGRFNNMNVAVVVKHLKEWDMAQVLDYDGDIHVIETAINRRLAKLCRRGAMPRLRSAKFSP